MQQTLQGRLQAARALQDQTKYAPVKASAAILLHILAQAVRIHDIGFCILAYKIDYLLTLRPQKLSDPNFRYQREVMMKQRPQGTALSLPTSLQGPSWAE